MVPRIQNMGWWVSEVVGSKCTRWTIQRLVMEWCSQDTDSIRSAIEHWPSRHWKKLCQECIYHWLRYSAFVIRSLNGWYLVNSKWIDKREFMGSGSTTSNTNFQVFCMSTKRRLHFDGSNARMLFQGYDLWYISINIFKCVANHQVVESDSCSIWKLPASLPSCGLHGSWRMM